MTPLTSHEPTKKPRIDALDDPTIPELTPAPLTFCATTNGSLALTTQVPMALCVHLCLCMSVYVFAAPQFLHCSNSPATLFNRAIRPSVFFGCDRNSAQLIVANELYWVHEHYLPKIAQAVCECWRGSVWHHAALVLIAV